MASAGNAAGSAVVDDSQNFDYMFKLLLVGNSGVGKTCYLFRYTDDVFRGSFVSTVGIDFKVKTITKHGKRIKLQIWDTAGQERYRAITTAYYRGSMGFILMYDIGSEESFRAVQDWSTAIKSYSWDNAQVILVGNKCDREDRKVTTAKGQQLADILGYSFKEASAKAGTNVAESFDELSDLIRSKLAETVDDSGCSYTTPDMDQLTRASEPSSCSC
ncbi:ras-related protein Rab-3D-like isoform X2 [Sycon ciliatum]|uniref:ras-related protein Rab-3D-like isoform X2 n=1 Tax=Sycon ciliatum TaxID=27933 RepID=UPI0031F6D2D5